MTAALNGNYLRPSFSLARLPGGEKSNLGMQGANVEFERSILLNLLRRQTLEFEGIRTEALGLVGFADGEIDVIDHNRVIAGKRGLRI